MRRIMGVVFRIPFVIVLYCPSKRLILIKKLAPLCRALIHYLLSSDFGVLCKHSKCKE